MHRSIIQPCQLGLTRVNTVPELTRVNTVNLKHKELGLTRHLIPSFSWNRHQAIGK